MKKVKINECDFNCIVHLVYEYMLSILPIDVFLDGAGRNLSDEEELFKKLFEDYNPSARPVMDSSHTVNVAIQFSLLHIKDLVCIDWRISS